MHTKPSPSMQPCRSIAPQSSSALQCVYAPVVLARLCFSTKLDVVQGHSRSQAASADSAWCNLQTKQAGRQWRPAGVRKITPSATTEPTPQVPAHIQALLQPSTSEQQQQLQTAFLDQYSAAEDKVPLSVSVCLFLCNVWRMRGQADELQLMP